jgi:hypothetical protein
MQPQGSLFAGRSSAVAYFSGMMAALLLISTLLSAAGAAAQAQQTGSLADAARQARAQKQTQPKTDSQAQQIADQLSEDQNNGDAPGGFKTYNAGAYKLSVPAPYTVNGHDEGGIVLAGPQVGSTRPLVMVGTPIVLRFGNSDDAFHDAATQFAHLYAQSSTCAKTTLANRTAYQCGLAGATLLEHQVSGSAMFVLGSGSIFPVFCVAPTESHFRDILNDPHSSYLAKADAQRNMEREAQDVKKAWQKCDTVFQSIHAVENAAQAEAAGTAKAGSASEKVAGTQDAPMQASTPASTAGATGAGNAQSALGDVARQLHQPTTQGQNVPPASASSNETKAAPTGFKVQPFNYCRSHNECWNASVLVPADAQLVSSDCKQFVFETKVQGAPFLLLAGAAGGDGCSGRSKGDPGLVRWNELAEPESARAPGTYSTISSLQATLDGKPAIITQIGFRKGLTEWRGKRAEIENNGVPLVVGCMASREHFDDGDAICSGLIESLRLP